MKAGVAAAIGMAAIAGAVDRLGRRSDATRVEAAAALPGAGTRLLIRARTSYEPAWPWPLTELFVRLVLGIGGFVNASAMPRGICCRAEPAHPRGGGSMAGESVRGRHRG